MPSPSRVTLNVQQTVTQLTASLRNPASKSSPILTMDKVINKYYGELLDPQELMSNVASRLWLSMNQRGISIGDDSRHGQFLSQLSTESKDPFERDFSQSLATDREAGNEFARFFDYWIKTEGVGSQPINNALGFLYANSISHGHSVNNIPLGDMYYNGQNPNRDSKTPFLESADPLGNALRYYQIAANAGHAGAAEKIANIHANHHGAHRVDAARSSTDSTASSAIDEAVNASSERAKVSYAQALAAIEAEAQKLNNTTLATAEKAQLKMKHNSEEAEEAAAKAKVVEHAAKFAAANQAAAAA